MKKKIGFALVAAMLATGAAVFAGSNTHIKQAGKSNTCTCAKCNNGSCAHHNCTCGK